MKRAAVCIGVAKTGGLPTLKVARKGAQDMHDWALANGIDSHLITDENGEVTVDQIRRKIRELLAPSSLEQLIIYFSGHGVNIRREEHWLLSRAPEDDEAVNVAAAEVRARYCGVPHVVFLSDACRTAPADTQNQSIDGSPIFPNLDYEGLENKVDLFWACTLGAPSLEIKDPNDSAKRHAVFTDELLSALKGDYPDVLVPDVPPAVVLRPRSLQKLLGRRIPERITELLGIGVPVKQLPDARINSEDTAWLARFDQPPEAPDAGLESLAFDAGPPPEPVSTIASVVREAVMQAVSPDITTDHALNQLASANVAGAKEIADFVQRESVTSGPDHMESQCGFKLRGAAVRGVTAEDARVEQLEPWLVRVWPSDQAHNILFELEDGRALVLPALRNFIATISFEDGELRNVAYEPSANSDLWPDYMQMKDELTTLRSLIAASADVGGFRLARADALQLADRIRFAKGVDPTMALYAAYTYHNLGRRDLIRDMQRYLRDSMGMTLFDVAMMASDKSVPREQIFPFAPLLAQGWSLIDAFGVDVSDDVRKLKRHVGTSLWTIYDKEAIPTLRKAMKGRQG